LTNKWENSWFSKILKRTMRISNLLILFMQTQEMMVNYMRIALIGISLEVLYLTLILLLKYKLINVWWCNNNSIIIKKWSIISIVLHHSGKAPLKQMLPKFKEETSILNKFTPNLSIITTWEMEGLNSLISTKRIEWLRSTVIFLMLIIDVITPCKTQWQK